MITNVENEASCPNIHTINPIALKYVMKAEGNNKKGDEEQKNV